MRPTISSYARPAAAGSIAVISAKCSSTKADTAPSAGSTAMKKNPPGAQFEILVDGKPQSYGDVKDVAIASAELIKSHNPLSDVAVRHMETGELTPVSYKPGII
jgi:hypothetical protein